MAYHLHHTVQFFNPLNEQLRIELYKKDVEPDEVTELLGTAFRCAYPKGEGDKFDAIIGMEAVLSLWLEDGDPDFDQLIVTYTDEWKMIAYDDNNIIFVGFLTPGEGFADFQDKPYEVTLTATDGLGLLKGIPLTNDAGESFEGGNLLIDYALAILNKTGLELGLRVISNITEESMETRLDNPEADTFNQTGLHARTFLKDAIEFYDCYRSLEILLSEYFSLYQWNGRWVILRIGELQDSPGAKVWYTDYDKEGNITDAAQSLDNAAAIGRDLLIHPVNAAQSIGSAFAVKSSRYTYNYTPWPELPTNNKFERGDLILLLSGPNYSAFTIDGWQYGQISPNTAIPPISTTPTVERAYTLRTFNDFGVEVEREVICTTPILGALHALVSEPVPISAGDKVSLSVTKKFTNNGVEVIDVAAFIILVSDDGSQFYSYSKRLNQPEIWEHNTWDTSGLAIDWQDEQTATYRSASAETLGAPINGNLYFVFPVSDEGAFGPLTYFKDIQFGYFPYIAGGYIRVKGDYAETIQDSSLQDKTEVEVYISDSLKKVLKGTLYRENLTDLTTPTWHRFNVDEQRHFKEIGELVRFNNSYRRMWKISGPFDGLRYTPADNPELVEPFSFHRHFTFPDSEKMDDRYFVLVPPLSIDYASGTAELNTVEVLHDGSDDGNQFGDTHEPLKYIFE